MHTASETDETTDIVIIQPPLVQLNTPYPSGAYLQAFFKRLRADRPEWGIGTVRWVDAGHRLYRAIFSAEGLTRLFALTQEKALALACNAEREGRDNEAFNLRRYVSMQAQWIRWIPIVTDILTGANRELCHEFVRSPAVPRGQRMETFLAGLERDCGADDARILASLALADVADYISATFDPAFALVRYAESLALSTAGFQAVEAALNAPILAEFYRPVLDEILCELGSTRGDCGSRLLCCVSCPFPGTLAASLYTGRRVKELLGPRAFVSLGGGYVNTELRRTKDARLGQFIDALSFDRGYGSYYDYFDNRRRAGTHGGSVFPLYKMRLFGADGSVCGNADAERAGMFGVCGNADAERACMSGECGDSFAERAGAACVAYERACTRELIPDYGGIDFSSYPRLADSRNPMHRLWSDGAWLKAYLAHGCYWHKCAFCDTSLDYVRAYCATDARKLYEGLSVQAARCGVRGVHFVDEAAPPVLLRTFALENLKSAAPLSFWGNIRYEKTFTRDLADLLAHGGMTGVSGGIEIASGRGLDAVCKGTDVDSIVGACAAFKEAGILTHAYMIYGYWLETPQLLVDSLETLRQLFAAGLLDSAFWHKFTLTRHSRVYGEYLNGAHPDLHPIVAADGAEDTNAAGAAGASVFAENAVRFEGDQRSARYADALNRSLDSWMHGAGLETPVGTWFDFPMPKPSVPRDYIEKSIERYERKRNRSFADYAAFAASDSGAYVWLGGKPTAVRAGTAGAARFQLCWTYLSELLYADFPADTGEADARRIADGLFALSPQATGAGGSPFRLGTLRIPEKIYRAVRGNGLCRTLLALNG